MRLPDRYEIKETPFFGGGMSTAYLCRDKHLERDVLVKILQNDTDPRRILDEVKALSTVRSKHVVQIYDVLKDSSGNISAIVEEFIPGIDLDAALPVSDIDTFLRYIYQISCGITDIHNSGVVHRDIKPNNMKIDAEGCIRIFDFGLSRSEDSDCKTIGVVGTPGFIAPELCDPFYGKVDFTSAVDVFAFASTALKLIWGKLPISLRTIPPSIPSLTVDFKKITGLPTEIASILNKCHSVNPLHRPAMQEVQDLVAKHLLYGRHKATMIVSGAVHNLTEVGKTVRLSAGSKGNVSIFYNGYEFITTNVTGSVYINNILVTPPQKLPGACVITLGSPELGAKRSYITFDVTHPEVGL